jgi:hypothetical protein
MESGPRRRESMFLALPVAELYILPAMEQIEVEMGVRVKSELGETHM